MVGCLPSRGGGGQQGLHFYKGKIGRFREVYRADEQAILDENLAPYLKRYGIRA